VRGEIASAVQNQYIHFQVFGEAGSSEAKCPAAWLIKLVEALECYFSKRIPENALQYRRNKDSSSMTMLSFLAVNQSFDTPCR
jgi:hypothetical protein